MLFGARRLIEGQRIPGIRYWGGFPSGKKKKGPSAGSFAGGGNPYYQNPDGSAKSEADQQATYDTASSSYSPSGSYTGPANSTVYPSAPPVKTASEKLKEYRKEAEKIVDSKVEFDTYDGLPKLKKSAAANVAKASAFTGAKASGSGKAKADITPPVPKGQLKELKKVEGTKFNAMDPSLKKNPVTGLSPKKQKAAKKAIGDSTLDDTLKELASVDSFKASAGKMKTALDDVVSGEKSPSQAYASVLLPGQDNSISPADRANVALTLFGAAGAFKAAKVASKVPAAVRAEKAANESLNSYKALKAAARTQAKKTRTGRTLVKVRDASTSKTGRAVKAAAYTGAGAEATRRGYTQAFVEGNLNAGVGKTVGTTAKVALGMPAALFGIGANTALTAKRALVAPLESNPEKQSSEYILGPTKTLAEETVKSGKKMLDVYTSGDAKRVERYTENVAGYFPLITGANVFSRGLLPGSKMVGEKATKAARVSKDTRMRAKHEMAARPADVEPLPVFPKLADAKKHVKIKRRVARAGTAMVQGENIGTNDLRGEVARSNWGAGKKVDKALAPLREKMYARYPGRKTTIDSVVSVPALAQFLGAEARVSQRSVSEALAQLTKLEEKIRANPKAKDGAPMLLQIEALKEHPYLMKRPNLTKAEIRKLPAKERQQVKAADTLWKIADARNKGVDLTPGTDRSKHAREVADAFAVEALSGKKTIPPEFKLDKQRMAEQVGIDAARKSVTAAQAKTRTLYKDLAVQRKKVERDRMAEAQRLKTPGRRPSKRLAQAETKLAAMEAEFAGHTATVKSDILAVRAAQNKLDARLTKGERQTVLTALPPDATPNEKKVALGNARRDKMEAEQAKAVAPIRDEFDRQMDAAMEKYGIERSSFIVHRTAQDMEKAPSAGSFDRPGVAKDKRRSGELLRTGEAVFDFRAAMDTIRNNVKREEDARMVRSLTEDHAYSTDLGNGKQSLFTPDEEARLLEEGRLIPGSYERVRAALLNDEETLSSILDSDDPTAALRDMMGKDRKGQLDLQALDAKGQGDRYYLMDAEAITYTLNAMKSLEGVFKFFNKMNGIGSRLVLNTSVAWLMAQPVAEMLVLLMHDPNPARLIRAMKVVKDAHDDPELMKALARGSDSALARETLQQDNKVYQGQAYDTAKVLKRSPVGAMAADLATARTMAYIDRAKGGWIRKVGYAAEVDRELNSTVRQFGRAVAGTMDDIEGVAGKLRTMDRKSQLKWLDTPDGRKAAEKLQSNVDGMLGNWSALGPTERQIAQLVFFYPFMRYSLDWMLHTFPRRHPIRYALLTSMSAWNAQQVEEFLGGKPSFFSGWAEAPIYGGPDGDATSTLPFARATPSGNTLVELFGESNSLASLSKGFSPALKPLSLIFNYDSFGKPRTDAGYGASEEGLASSFSDLLSNAKEQAIGFTFPGRYLDRQLGDREPQPGDEGPTQIGPLSVDTYGLRSGVFPFVPHDKKQASVGAAVAGAYDERGEAYGQSQAGGDRYSELNKKFEGADLGAPAVGSPLRKEYVEWNELRKQRKEGTKEIAKQEEILRGLYKQEGIPVPDTLQVEARTGELVGGTLSKKDRLELNRALGAGPGARASIMRGRGEVGNDGLNTWFALAGEKPTPKYVPLKPKQKVSLANQILDTKEKMVGGIKLPDKSEQTFVNTIAAETGLSPRMVAAWTRQENGNAFGDWNRLNIGQTDSGPVGPANEADKWTDPKTAGHWTAEFIKGNFGGADQRIVDGLAAAVGKPDMEQIDLLDATPWAGDPAYGEHLRGTYADVANAPMLKPNPGLEKKFEQLVRRGKAAGLYDAPKMSGYVYPTAKKGTIIATPKDHASRAFGNWMSDNAVDIAVPAGTPVKAVAGATVSRISGSAPNHAANPAGWTVYLKDKSGEEFAYMHLDEYNVKAGQKVKAGQALGKSGAANGVEHLHFAAMNSNPIKDIKSSEQVKGKLPGPFDGARTMTRKIVGTPVRGDKETGHSPTGDHTPGMPGYAQDINSIPGTMEAEREPEYNQATLDKIVSNLQQMGSKVPTGLRIGENWDTGEVIGGYRIQLLTNEGGTVNHIHVGVRYEGDGTESVPVTSGASIMEQAKAERYGVPTTGSTSQTAGSTTTTAFPSATAPSGNTSDRQAPYNQRMNKWQKLMDFRADPTGTTGATTGVASDSTLPDLSAAEQIANLPSTKRKKNYA